DLFNKAHAGLKGIPESIRGLGYRLGDKK
ncbi:hypothetical protein ACW7B2_23210, partial [Klebsiella pneumoniae]